ncbi:YqaE/Pmp3 family membrane protein [Aeromonas dhakensis]|nr:YqaE/Pmp3 family membrane protein [Aeromonas dhakensis]RQM95237.1 YqaE/Pmp3 family membrane protein [Aeromonas dhakensis]
MTSLTRTSEMNNLLKILLAIFLPPVCAFIQVGFSLHFLINIVLTLLGGLPGMVHALWLVVSDKRG